MTKDEIWAMEAGEELDKLVIKELMHHIRDDSERPRCKICSVWKDWYKPAGCEDKKYSTDISAAWQVVEKLKDYYPEIEFNQYTKKWEVTFLVGETASADTAPEAICKSALIAVLQLAINSSSTENRKVREKNS